MLSAGSVSLAPDPSGMERDLDYIRRAWKRMRALLSDTEEVELQEESTKRWIYHLKILARDAEELLDLCKHELARSEVDRERDVASRKVRASPLCLFSDASFRSEMAGKMRMFREEFDLVMQQRSENQMCGSSNNNCDDEGDEDWMFEPVIVKLSDPTTVLAKQEIFGRDEETNELIDMLTHGDESSEKTTDVQVIGVVATGGVGKTTLVRRVYDNPVVNKHFDVKGWVSVSMDFDLVRLTRDAVRSITGNKSSDFIELNKSQKVLKQRVEDKRFLLVLDDVWNENGELWDRFKSVLTFGASGSRILITTRDRSVATTTRAREFALDYLPFKHCWSLFELCAFGGGMGSTGSDIPKFKLTIGREIVWKCGRVPLVVKVLGGLLRFEDDERTWNGILESELWEIQGGLAEEIMGPLRLSYTYLPAYLKPCFAYCSVFPKDHYVEKEELVRLWMVEGLVQDKEGQRTTEEVGMECIEELVSRSFLQPQEESWSPCGGVKALSISMHDLMHDLAQHVSRGGANIERETRLIPSRAARQRPPSDCGIAQQRTKVQATFGTLLVADRMSFGDEQLSNCLLEREDWRALDLREVSIQKLPDSLVKLKLLRYLTLADSQIQLLPSSLCTLYNLQVLNLRSTPVTELPSSLGNLKQLRHLILKDSEIKSLPESVCALYQLRVLDLSCTPIQVLPDSFGNLRQLRQCLLRETAIRTLPESINMLRNLQVLDLGSNWHIEVLPGSIGKLKHLRRLHLFGTRVKQLPGTAYALYNLQHLDLTHAYCFEGSLESIGNFKRLRSLSLLYVRNFTRVPDSICALHNLWELELSWTGIRELPEAIGNLRSLFRLNLVGTGIKRLPESVCELHNLQFLNVNMCGELHELPGGIWKLTNLIYLGADAISSLPAGMGKLSKLKTLLLFPVGTRIEDAGIAELKDLSNLAGELSITGLRNVVTRTGEGKVANLKNKMHLEKLTLNWKAEAAQNPHMMIEEAKEEEVEEEEEEEDEEVVAARRDDELLEDLEPHANIKKLEISGYGGVGFPEWLGHPSFTNLISLKLSNCSRCSSLLPDFRLPPAIQSLVVEHMPSLQHIGSALSGIDDQGTTQSPFHYRSLVISNCPQLSSVRAPAPCNMKISRCKNLESVGFFGGESGMSSFDISKCPSLQPPSHLPAEIDTLGVEGCPSLEKWCQQEHHFQLSIRKIVMDGRVVREEHRPSPSQWSGKVIVIDYQQFAKKRKRGSTINPHIKEGIRAAAGSEQWEPGDELT